MGERRVEGRDINSALGQASSRLPQPRHCAACKLSWGNDVTVSAGQQRVNKLDEGIAASTEAAVQGGAKGAQGLEILSGHTAQGARTSRRWHFRRSALSLGLHHQLS